MVPSRVAWAPLKTRLVPLTVPLTGVATPRVVKVPAKLLSQGFTPMLSVEPSERLNDMLVTWKRATSAIAAGTASAAAAASAVRERSSLDFMLGGPFRRNLRLVGHQSSRPRPT